MLRAPEVILGAPWDHRVDIWNIGALVSVSLLTNFGCVLIFVKAWELAEGKVLFDGTATPDAPYTPEAHLAQMMAVLGEIPETFLQKGQRSKQFFDNNGKILVASPFPPCTLEEFNNYPESQDKTEYLRFLRSMLKLDPGERPDASELLKAQWLRE